MPNLYITMEREPGWNTETFRAELMKKAQVEKIKVREPGYVYSWEGNPIIYDHVDTLKLVWHYKRWKK